MRRLGLAKLLEASALAPVAPPVLEGCRSFVGTASLGSARILGFQADVAFSAPCLDRTATLAAIRLFFCRMSAVMSSNCKTCPVAVVPVVVAVAPVVAGQSLH